MQFLPLGSSRVRSPTAILWDRLERLPCTATSDGAHGVEGKSFPSPAFGPPVQLIQSVHTKCHTQQLRDAHWHCSGSPRTAREGGRPVVYTGVTAAAWAEPGSFATASSWRVRTGCEGRQVTALWATSWSWMVVSQKWKTTGVKHTHRCWLERFVVHRKDRLRDDLQMANFQQHRAVGKQKGEWNC